MKQKTLGVTYQILSQVISLIIFILVYVFYGDAISIWQFILGWFILSLIIIWIMAFFLERLAQKGSKDPEL